KRTTGERNAATTPLETKAPPRQPAAPDETDRNGTLVAAPDPHLALPSPVSPRQVPARALPVQARRTDSAGDMPLTVAPDVRPTFEATPAAPAGKSPEPSAEVAPGKIAHGVDWQSEKAAPPTPSSSSADLGRRVEPSGGRPAE